MKIMLLLYLQHFAINARGNLDTVLMCQGYNVISKNWIVTCTTTEQNRIQDNF